MIILISGACASESESQILTTSSGQDTTITTPVISTTVHSSEPKTTTTTSATSSTTVHSSEPQTTTTTVHTLTLNPTLDPTVFYVAYIVIDPQETSINAGESQLFTVTAYDYEDHSFDVTRDCDFIISSDAGGRWEFNKYFSANIGNWQVHADYWNPTDGTEFWRDTAMLTVQ